MDICDDIEFNFTQDNSLGLYDKNTHDIFHSKTGALKEANEKFINPLISFINGITSDKISILDVCYGIGYNTKAFLRRFGDKNILIDALEYNENYACLSPFIFDTINDDDLRIFILSELYSAGINTERIKRLIKEIYDNNSGNFFAPFMSRFNALILDDVYKNTPFNPKLSFLHNIYYNYISNITKFNLKVNKYGNSKIRFKFGDARKTIFETDTKYDVVFLDAFSSQIDPVLWTIDFLSEIKCKMNEKSVLVTYSKSTPFRAALLELGFRVGKTFINSKDMGTVASFDKNLISSPLSDFDLELINTRSGICYRDKFLNLTPDIILKNRENEMKLSNRISHTKFLKVHNIK